MKKISSLKKVIFCIAISLITMLYINNLYAKDEISDTTIKTQNTTQGTFNVLSNWNEGLSKVEIDLKYLNTSDPLNLDLTGNNKITNNLDNYITISLTYKSILYTYADTLPIGSVLISYKSPLPAIFGKPEIPTGSHFKEKSWNPSTGILVLENFSTLEPGSSGFINLAYQINGRKLVSNEMGKFTDNNIYAAVNVNLNGGLAYTETTNALHLAVELKKDQYKVLKEAKKASKTVSNDPNLSNSNDFYWVDYVVDLRAEYFSRELEKGQIIDTLPKDAILVSITEYANGEEIYNSYNAVKAAKNYISYIPDSTGATGGQIIYKFDRNDPNIINLKATLQKFIVKVKYPKTIGTMQTRVNHVEVKGFYEGESENYALLTQADASIILDSLGFIVYGTDGDYAFKKVTLYESPRVINANALQYADQHRDYLEDYYYYASKLKETAPIDFVICDDLMYYSSYRGSTKMLESEYNFYTVSLIRPISGLNTGYEFYVRYKGSAINNYVLYKQGTLTNDDPLKISLDSAPQKVVGFKIIYKNITGTFNAQRLGVAGINFSKTSMYVDGTRPLDERSKISNYAYMDIYKNGTSLMSIDRNSYKTMADDTTSLNEALAVADFDLNNYGKYLYRSKAEMLVEEKVYRALFLKWYSSVAYNTSTKDYTVSWQMSAQSRYGDMLQNYNIVDILPLGFTYKDLRVITKNSTYPFDYTVSVEDNYKGSGRQRVIISIKSPDKADQRINEFTFALNTIIKNIEFFKQGEIIENYAALITKDIPYPSTDRRVGTTAFDAEIASRDDGSYFKTLIPGDVELWNDADNDRGTNDYAWYYSGSVTVPALSSAGNTGIQKYVKTNITDQYTVKDALSSLNTPYEYAIFINNSVSDLKNIVIYDIFPFVSDVFKEKSNGNTIERGSEWSGEFLSLYVIPPDGASYKTYYTQSQTPGALGSDSSWKEAQAFLASGKTLADVKAIAIDFSGYTLPAGKSIRANITMRSPSDVSLVNKTAINTFYYTFVEKNGNKKEGESNAVNLKLVNPIAYIGDTLFEDKNKNSKMDSSATDENLNEKGIGNANVTLYKKVDTADSDTITYNSNILKKVDETKTSNSIASLGTYKFEVHESGIYYVKFEIPSTDIYEGFSTKSSINNTDESVQLSKVDNKGFTDSITIDFAHNNYSTISYLFADAGLIPKASESSTKATSESTSEATSEATSELTSEATSEPTSVSTSEATSEPTSVSTSEATSEPTSVSTSEATSESTSESTSKAISESTSESTSKATSESTSESTSELTSESTSESTSELTTEDSSELTSETQTQATEKETKDPNDEMKIEVHKKSDPTGLVINVGESTPDLSLSNEKTAVVKENQKITYTITAQNKTNNAISNVIIKDNIPAGTTFVNQTNPENISFELTDNTLKWLIPKLDANEIKEISFTVYVNELNKDVSAKEIRNTAYLIYEDDKSKIDDNNTSGSSIITITVPTEELIHKVEKTNTSPSTPSGSGGTGGRIKVVPPKNETTTTKAEETEKVTEEITEASLPATSSNDAGKSNNTTPPEDKNDENELSLISSQNELPSSSSSTLSSINAKTEDKLKPNTKSNPKTGETYSYSAFNYVKVLPLPFILIVFAVCRKHIK